METEVLFESWFLKSCGTEGSEKKGFFKGSSSWKNRYFMLIHRNGQSILQYFIKKPKTLNETPKVAIPLTSHYRIEKVTDLKGKPFVFKITTSQRTLLLAAENERMLCLFVFFIQTQTKLREELEEQCFIVRPDNTEENRLLGARGNMCILHVSPHGIILALQLSKSVLCFWPLKSIRLYDTTGKGQFGFETGRKAPMGLGKYTFNTRMGHDYALYDRIDNYVMEAAGLKETAGPLQGGSRSMGTEMQQLQMLTVVQGDNRFSAHLKRISRNIYDQLDEHIGGDTSMRVRASNPDLLSDTPTTPRHEDSLTKAKVRPPMLKAKSVGHHPQHSTDYPYNGHSYVGASDMRNGGMSNQIKIQKDAQNFEFDSQYLHMPTPENTNGFSRSQSSSPGNVSWMTPPPSFLAATSYPLAEESRGAVGGVDYNFQRQRLQSKSHEDLSDYMKMNMDLLMKQGGVQYDNETFQMSDESVPNSPGSGEYATVQDNRLSTISNPYSYVSTQYMKEVARYRTQNGPVSPRLYSRPLPKAMRKSLSNPNLLLDTDKKDYAKKGKKSKTLIPLQLHGLPNRMSANQEGRLSEQAQSPTILSPTSVKGISLTTKSKVFKKQTSQTVNRNSNEVNPTSQPNSPASARGGSKNKDKNEEETPC